MTHYSAHCCFPSTKTIQLQRKASLYYLIGWELGLVGEGNALAAFLSKRDRAGAFWGFFYCLGDYFIPGMEVMQHPWGEVLVGVPLLGGPWPAPSDPTGCLHNFSLNNLELHTTCERGMIHSQMQPGEGTAGMSRVSRSLCMKKISDGRSALLFCGGGCNKIPQERLKWKYPALKAEIS